MEALVAAGAVDVAMVRLALRGSTSVTGVQRRSRPGAGVAGAGRGAAAGGRGHRRGGWGLRCLRWFVWPPLVAKRNLRGFEVTYIVHNNTTFTGSVSIVNWI
jgi:hypothetical protein